MKKPKFNKQFDFDTKLLDELASDEGSCVHVQKLQHHLALHPFHLNDLNNSVRDILNRDVAKYSAKLDGILFGYKNIKFLSRLGQISDDSCFVHVDIEADFFIFKPTEGKTLQGVVNKKSEDHVGCLVHKIFNVALPRPKHGNDWLGHSVDISSEILLTITNTNFEGRLPYIRGEIISVLSNPIDDDTQNENEETLQLTKAKLPKKLYFEDDEESEIVEETPTKNKSKKRKKSVSEADILEEEPSRKRRKKSLSEVDILEEEPRKKKRNKSLSEVDILEEEPRKKKRNKSLSEVDKLEEGPSKKKRNKSLSEVGMLEEEPSKKRSKKSKKSSKKEQLEEEDLKTEET